MKKLFLLICILSISISSIKAQTNDEKRIDSLANLKAKRIVDSTLKAIEESKKKSTPIPRSQKFNLKITADGTINDGNVQRQIFISRLNTSLSEGIFWFSMNPVFTYGETNKRVQEREFFTDISSTIFYQKRVYGLGFGVIEKSNLRAIEIRDLIGAGVGIRFIKDNPNAELSTSVAVIYEKTNFIDKEDIQTMRLSVRLRGNYNVFKNRLKLSHLSFFQPSLTDRKNLRWNGIATVEIPFSKRINIRASIENSYESIVAPNRKNNDFRTTFGISFTK
ncbi:MAG: DUF481 domain-containing protein [Bacteroidia bacterium]|nr:DUF481 domain-containing protein [Bacteroidia bacterium]MDW8348059.1 DUF481 domain-containing protein [Bacteroidia bacterium]